MATLGPFATVEHTIFRYYKADEEEIDDVEDANTPDDLPRSFGNLSPRIVGLGSS